MKELNSKKLSKYIAAFDYFDKGMIVLSATNGGLYIVPFATVIGATIGIASASFSFAFSLIAGIIKKLLQIIGNKKNIIRLLC